MKRIIYYLIVVVMLFALQSCSNDDEPKDKVEEIRIEVSSETGITYHWDDDKKEYPIECMLVKLPSQPDIWQPMMFGEIEGFRYEKGVEYELSVIRTTLSNPPADGSVYTYRLERIISHRVVNVNISGLDSCIEIPAAGKDFDIDFTTNAPCEIARITGDRFGDMDLVERYNSGDSNSYLLRLKIPQNSGMGRVGLLTLRFSNGDEKEIGIWQMPKTFSSSATFELPSAGSLGYMLGNDETNFGKIRDIKIIGTMNANDAYYLKRILKSHNYQGYGEKPAYTLDLTHSGFVAGDKGRYSSCGICDIKDKDLPSVYSNEVPSGIFTSNKYLTQVTLPEGIKAINASAFSHCISLREINIPSCCIEIGSQAFNSCTSLTKVDFPYISDEIALPHLQTIGESAFSNIGHLKSFVLPESLKTVATTALSFYVDSLFSLTEAPPVWDIPGNAGYVVGPKPDGCTLYVPFGCSEAYKASEKWSQFKIEEMPEDNWWEMIP